MIDGMTDMIPDSSNWGSHRELNGSSITLNAKDGLTRPQIKTILKENSIDDYKFDDRVSADAARLYADLTDKYGVAEAFTILNEVLRIFGA